MLSLFRKKTLNDEEKREIKLEQESQDLPKNWVRYKFNENNVYRVRLDSKGCMYKLLMDYQLTYLEYRIFHYIDQLHINVTIEKEKIFIAKGLHNAQFNRMNNIIITISLLISIINIIFASFNDEISSTGITLADVGVAILSIIIAYFAKVRDQKEDLIHNMLTTLNDCDTFLNKCEQITLNYLKLKNQEQQIQVKNDDAQITDVDNSYLEILSNCNEIIEKFNSEDAQAITNGPLKMFNQIKNMGIIFDSKYLKKLMTGIVDMQDIDFRYCYIVDKNIQLFPIKMPGIVDVIIQDENPSIRFNKDYILTNKVEMMNMENNMENMDKN